MHISRTLLRALLIGFLYLIATPAVHAGAQSHKQPSLDSWFDSLGYSESFNKPFVSFTPRANGPPRIISGFLLSRRNGLVKVLTLDLSVEIYKQQEGVSTAPVDFQSWVRERLGYYNESYNFNASLTKEQLKSMYDFAEEAYVVSKICKARGLSDLAAQCLSYSKKFASIESLDLETDVRNSIEQSAFTQLYKNFDDHDYSRPDLAFQFKTFLKEFPNSSNAGRAEEDLAALESMIIQDSASQSKAPVVLDKLSIKDRIAEEIYRLRDHFGNFWDPYAGDIVWGEGISPDSSPTDLPSLEAEGLAAVPQLIQALNDKTLTRCCCEINGTRAGMGVLRVGDLCERVLEHISHQTFAGDAEAPMQNDPIGVEAAIKKWWETQQTVGEEPVLIAAVGSGDLRSVLDSAGILAKKYPDDAAGPIVDAIAKEQGSNFRVILINDLGLLDSPKAKNSLEKLMWSGPDLSARVAAAEFVQDYDADQAFAAAIDNFDSHEKKPGEWSDSLAGSESLLHDLTTWNPVEGFHLIQGRMKSMPQSTKRAILRYFDQSTFFRQGQGTNSPADKAFEALLVGELSDRSDGVIVTADSNCQIASECLSRLWPSRYHFLKEASHFELNREVIENINYWRKANGRELIPLPVELTVLIAPSALIDPLVEEAISAKNEAERSSAIREIRELGLPALPAVLRALKTGSGGSANPELQTLAKELDVLVAGMRVAGPKDTEALEWARSEKHKALDAADIIRFFKSTLLHHPKGIKGLRFDAFRDKGASGFTVVLTFGTTPGSTNGIAWDFNIDGKMVEGGSGGGDGPDFGKDPSDGAVFDQALTKAMSIALAAKPEHAVSIEVEFLLPDR
ncbi:MAG TPA: hypothetical protein VGL56_05370 [Fimbriimonadaceae bacterium]